MVAEQDRDCTALAAELGQGTQALTRHRVAAALPRPEPEVAEIAGDGERIDLGLERPNEPGKPPAPPWAIPTPKLRQKADDQ